MRLLLSLILIVNSTAASVFGQELMARINQQTGQAEVRSNKGKSERISARRDLGKPLRAGQEIRCISADCKLELSFCTGGKIFLTFNMKWYRIPFLDCEQEKFLPGYKNYLFPGGRHSQNYLRYPVRFNSSAMVSARKIDVWDLSLEDIIARRPSIWNRGGVGDRGGMGDRGGVGDRGSSNWYDYGLPPSRLPQFERCPGDSYRWLVSYPYERVIVPPDLFSFHFERLFVTSGSLVASLWRLDYEKALPFSESITRVINIENGKLVTPDEAIRDIQLFLRNSSVSSSNSRARIFCALTLLSNNTANPIEQHTVGFEFFVATSDEEQLVRTKFEIADRQAGISRYLGRAELFEDLGLIDLAEAEYDSMLRLWPENWLAQTRRRGLSMLGCHSPFR